MASLVQGEDSESDEEINTDQLVEGSLGLSPSLRTSLQSDPHKASIVAGEESETDEEDEGGAVPVEQTDRGRAQHLKVPSAVPSQGSSRASSRRASLDSTTQPPRSLLHQRLRETNITLRKGIVDRILRMYHAICKNLTVVNDNLSRAQGTIEKVNAHLKRSDNDLAQLNATMQEIQLTTKSFASTLRMDVALPRKRAGDTPVASLPSTPERGTDVTSPSPPRIPSAH